MQRAEFWRIILALQASRAVHLCNDNLNVVRHVGRLLGGTHAFRPLELENDGDLVGLIQRMIRSRREETVLVTKVKGHAEQNLVRRGQIRELDREVIIGLMRLRIWHAWGCPSYH